MSRRVMADERGESLLELLIAVMIIGIAVVAIIGGLVTSVLLSDVHRKQATADVAVRDYAESLVNSIANGGYTPCATTYPATTMDGDAVSVVASSMRYWNGTGFQTACPSPDSGLQEVTLQATSGDGRATETLTVVLRKPCGLGPTTC